MAQKTLRQFSAPSNSHIPTGLNNYQGTDGFEIKTGLVKMVQASPFCGKASEDTNARLQNFLEVSSIINPKGTTMDNIRLQLLPFSFLGKAKTWFYAYKEGSDTWDTCANAFWTSTFRLAKPMPFETGFPVFNNSRTKQSWKPGNIFRNTLQHAHTTARKNGLSFRSSSMA